MSTTDTSFRSSDVESLNAPVRSSARQQNCCPTTSCVRLPTDGDLLASDAALSTTRQALARGLQRCTRLRRESPQSQLTALVLGRWRPRSKSRTPSSQRRAEVALGVREALSALRNAPSTAALAERAPIEARRIGFRRALFSMIENGTWMARAAFAVDDPDFGDGDRRGRPANPRRLNGPLIESEMVRRVYARSWSPTPVEPAGALRVHPLHRHHQLCRGPVRGLGSSGGDDARRSRHRLSRWTNSTATSWAPTPRVWAWHIERTQLMERLQAVRRATADYLAGVSCDRRRLHHRPARCAPSSASKPEDRAAPGELNRCSSTTAVSD